MNHVDELIEFETIKEDWSIYECYDGTIIKVKNVLVYLVTSNEVNEDGQNIFWNSMSLVSGVFSPIEIRGEPDRKYLVEELKNYVTEENIMFRTTKDADFNEYQTEIFTIKIQTRVNRIDKTSKFDQRGLPQYIINSSTQFIVEGEKLPVEE